MKRKKLLAIILAGVLGMGSVSVGKVQAFAQEEPFASILTETTLTKMMLDHLYVDVDEKGNCSMIVSWNNAAVTKMELTVEDEGGNQTTLSNLSSEDNAFLFEHVFAEGVYHVSEIKVYSNNAEQIFPDKELQIDAYFSVGGQSIEEKKSESIELVDLTEIDTEMEASIISVEDGNVISTAGNIAQALSAAEEESGEEKARTGDQNDSAEEESDRVVVVLDPGHDSTHGGASAGALKEDTLNFKIAEYCREELLTYDGVKVFMTRDSLQCPYPGTSAGGDNKKRVEFAKSVGADVYVSLHLNSGGAAKGAEVYYPNSSYDADIYRDGRQLAQDVLNELVALGLANRGIKFRNSESGTYYYSDGTASDTRTDVVERRGIADYYAVIKNSKLSGFPAIIIEHAFISSGTDAANFLKTEEGLKKLGVADATGIAKYFELAKSGNRYLKYDSEKKLWYCYIGGKIDESYTGLLEAEDHSFIYIKNGVSDLKYNGIAENGSGFWKVTNGVVDQKYTGFAGDEEENWYYFKNGTVQYGTSDIIKGNVKNTSGWWRVEGGRVNFDFTGFAENENGWWYLRDGQVHFDDTGVIKGKVKKTEGWWHVVESKVTFDDTVAKNENGWWRVEGGRVNFDFTGFAENEYGWWYLRDGQVHFDDTSVIKGKVKETEGWWHVVGSKVTFESTVARNKNGWWRIEEGKVNFDFTGFAENEYGWWYLRDGQVHFDDTSVIKGKVKETEGWWHVVGSKVTFDDTVAKNENGWWRIEEGKVNFDFTGFAENENGWWYLRDGQVHFDDTSVIKGKVKETEGWWHVVGSKVTFDDTVAKNENGWWRIENGQVNFEFNGIAENENGWWLLENGKVNFDYNGTIIDSEKEYVVTSGKVAK